MKATYDHFGTPMHRYFYVQRLAIAAAIRGGHLARAERLTDEIRRVAARVLTI